MVYEDEVPKLIDGDYRLFLTYGGAYVGYLFWCQAVGSIQLLYIIYDINAMAIVGCFLKYFKFHAVKIVEK